MGLAVTTIVSMYFVVNLARKKYTILRNLLARLSLKTTPDCIDIQNFPFVFCQKLAKCPAIEVEGMIVIDGRFFLPVLRRHIEEIETVARRDNGSAICFQFAFAAIEEKPGIG
jgi:hypothetical protein